MENASTATVAGRAWACAIRFNALVSQASQTTSAFEDQLARFNIWAANIGVFAEAHASLDYRVRNSPKVKAMVMQLLQALKRKIQFALDTVERYKETDLADNTSGVADARFDDTHSKSSQSESSKTSTVSSNSSQTSASDIPSTPLVKSAKDVEAAISRLHRLTMLIRKSSTHNQNLTATKFAVLDENGDDTSTQFESFALRIVQARFPVANPILHKRLANLILQRRKVFSYQQRHQQKLAKVVHPAARHSTVQQPPRTHPEIQLAQSSQSSQRGGPSHPKALLQGLAINKALSTTTASAMTVTSVLSRPASSIVSSSAASSSPDTTAILFPPAPKVATNAKEFQCPYCGLMLGIKEKKPRRWRKHVVSDLEPYVCLFENCNMDNQSFRSVDNWIKHMRWEHTLRWYCGVSSCQNLVFDEQSMFENHMELFHPRTYSSSQLPMLIESMRRPSTEVFEYCPLCHYVPEIQQTSVSNRRTPVCVEKADNLHKHVATHLEGLALFSLPWQNDVYETSSSRETQSKEKRSTLKNAGVSGLDEVSLSFDDPPKFELLGDEQQALETVSQSESTTDTLVELEWGFVPSIPYDDHSQDRVLQSLIRKYLSTHVEELGSKPSTHGELGVGSTQAELQTICDWISPMDFTAKHEQVLAIRQEGICEWFLQSPVVTNFIAHAKKILWVPGIPGSGKTVLSSAIIDYLKHFTPSSPHRAAVAYAYCDYRLQESQTTICLVACFLRQLLEVFWEINAIIPNDVQATYDLHKEARTSPSMAEYLKMFSSVVAGGGSVFVVIDALDECTPDTRRELIETLKSVEPGIHLLITSRYLGDIKEKLGDVSRVDVLAPEEDLKSYAQVCVERHSLLRTQLGTLSDETRDGYLGKIAQSAAGMFPVVQLLVRSWADAPRLLGAGPPSLSHVSREMDTFYGEIMERIFHQASLDATLARQVLIWVAFSRRPVTGREITHAISAEVLSGVIASRQGVQVDSELLTTVCAGILAIDSETGTLHPAHVTVKEYLQRNREDIFAQSQEYITASCLEYLSLEEFKEGPCTSDQAMLARLRQHPFFHYAASEWGHHALGAAEITCKEAIITFLDNKLAVESAMQAKSMPSDWQFYPQSIDSKAYPHDVPGIAFAALFGLATTVEAMLGNSDNKTSGDDNAKALFWAATGGSGEVAKLLLARGVSPNVPGAMRAAAENGHENVIHIIIENGGDVDVKGYEDDGNALQTAAIKGNENLIRLLLEHGADPNIEGGELGSVLHIAAVNGDETITQLLLEHGADPNTKGGMYGFALQAAVEEGNENIIQILLDNGAEVNLEGGPYGNAFQAAVENGDRDIVELLLAHGANVDTMIGGEKYTALQEVARRGSEGMVELLIDKGASIGSQQRNGQTALHQAAKEGQTGVVALLLRKGANHNTRDQRGFTALDWAKKKNFSKVVKVLEAGRQQQN